jgi:predicted aldo/keto reductase-like oxidoreductase
MSSGERRVLEGYAAALDRDYCRPGCDGCLDACPQKVRIHDILRYRLYFNNYGREKYAMNLYAALPSGRNAANCGSCAGQCSGSCAFGLDIRSRLADAHNELTI